MLETSVSSHLSELKGTQGTVALPRLLIRRVETDFMWKRRERGRGRLGVMNLLVHLGWNSEDKADTQFISYELARRHS